MSLFNEFIQSINKDALERVEKLIEEKGIKEKLEDQTEQLASQCANSIIDPQAPNPPAYKGVDFNKEDPDQYLLILDYFQSSGLQFTTQTLKYESQHPNITVDRKRLAEKYGLRAYDKTPLLVQMIEQRLKMIGNEE